MARHGPKPMSPAEAIHIVHGRWCPANARDVIVLYDQLTLGPCHIDPEVHRTLRTEYWASFDRDTSASSGRRRHRGEKARRDYAAREIRSSDQLIAALERFPQSHPIVLWTSPNPGNRIAYWWTLDALECSGTPNTRCWIADSRYPENGPHALYSPGAHTPEMIANAFTTIVPLTRTRLRNGASLWAKFASPLPVVLDRARRSAQHADSDRRAVEELHFWGLPRVLETDANRLRLSEFDQLLLGHLSDQDWIRPYDVLIKAIDDIRVRRTLPVFGDGIFSARFRVWAAHRSDEPVLDRRSLPEGANNLTTVSYRLTPKGRRIVAKGLDHPDEAPEFYVGGCRGYRGNPVWARHIHGAAWRVLRWKPPSA